MINISKLSDYALVILANMNEDEIFSSSFLNQKTHIPLATTNKILRLLCVANLCSSKKGKDGGFYLLKPKSSISILDVINAIETNQLAFTECSSFINACKLHNSCKISKSMNVINNEIQSVLKNYLISSL